MSRGADAAVLRAIAPKRDATGPGLEPTACDQCGSDSHESCAPDAATMPREFNRVDDGAYRLTIPDVGIEFGVDRLRRERGELIGELTVKCSLPGARTFDGVLGSADFNFSSQRTRKERAEHLSARSRADLDWLGLLEEFVQRVLTAERAGQPAVLLRDLPRPKPDDTLTIDRLPLLARHPMIMFGDGGSAKSYLALYLAGRLDRAGVRVGLFDWELAADDHRERLELLFGPELPAIRYVRCDKPLYHETDRIRRIIRDEQLAYGIFDSIAFACDDAPEKAEVAGRYFRSVRQFGPIGSLHIAHVNKSEGGDRKPFGSSFWFNGARSCWFVKLAEPTPGSSRISLGLYHRKANLGGLRPAVGFEIEFGDERTDFRSVSVADTPDLAANLSVRQRMLHLLRSGALAADEVASEISADAETVKRTARRYKNQFVLLDGGKVGLLGASS